MKYYTSFLLSSVLLVAVSARADEATKTAKVEEFLRISHTEALVKEGLAISMNQVRSGFIQQMVGVKLPPEQNVLIKEFQNRVEGFMVKTLAWENLKLDYIKLFSSTYTEPQIDDLIAFYRSPTGQAMVAKSPELMNKANGLVQQKMIAAQPELQKLMSEFAGRARSTVVPSDPK